MPRRSGRKLWLNWEKYRQFWSQIAQWSLRRLENADFTTEVTVDKGEGLINVEALDEQGNYRNFLNLQAVVVSPKGERQTVRLEQTGPGHYEARFPTKEVGAYLLNLMDVKDGQVRGSQVVGASVNYSPEFIDHRAQLSICCAASPRAAAAGSSTPPASAVNPFSHDRQKTYPAPRSLGMAIKAGVSFLFVFDVGVRRIQIDRDEYERVARAIRRFYRAARRALPKPRSLCRPCWLGATPCELGKPPRRSPAPSCSVAEAGHHAFARGRISQLRSARPAGPIAIGRKNKPETEVPASTTSRLLEAKRRAQKRKG